MNSKHKGDLALSKAIAYFMENGFEVLLPIGDKRPYDLVVEKHGILQKVQCKYTSHKRNYGVYSVPLRVMGGNRSSGCNAKKYNKEDFDILFAYTSEGTMYNIPFKDITSTNSYSLGNNAEKYKVKYGSDALMD